ncbi:MAG: glutathione S-transferase family protein [Cyanophyceae cyanobacterium]
MMQNKLKLYGAPRTRAAIAQWYLEELKIPYEYVQLDMKRGENLAADFRAINPFGKVPAIDDGKVTLWESGAILLYLDRAYGPEKSEGDRALDTQWVHFANATLAVGLFVDDRREKETPRLLEPLNQILGDRNYLTGSVFGVADVAVGSLLFYLPIFFKMDLSDYPAVQAYMKRLGDRPAFKASVGAR